jgi:ribA/ribD-fused uncharacterized protein
MSDQPPIICFYSTRDEYGCLSNFYPAPVEIDGKTWPTTEHYFQAMKFTDPKLQGHVRRARTPKEAAARGRDRKHPLRRDWEKVKEEIMRKAVLAKFTQHADLRAILLGTGEAILVEHTANDSYWGDGGDGSGRNALGHILMSVRAELRRQAEQA